MQRQRSVRIKFGNKVINAEILLCLIIVIDLLVFPYFRALHCGLGMILVALWSMLNFTKIRISTWSIVLFVVISNIIGMLFFNIGTGGITNAVLVVYIFFLYDYFSYNLKNVLNIVKWILLLYVVFNLLLALVYMRSPQQYFSIRSFWTMSGSEINFTELEINRFTGVFSDPNNAGGALVLILSYFLAYERLRKMQLICLLLVVFLCVVLTFSVSAMVLFVLALIIGLSFAYKTQEQRKNRNTIIVFLIVSCVALIVYVGLTQNILSDNVFIKILKRRIERNSANNLGGRLTIWKNLITTVSPLNFLLVGHGAVLDALNQGYLPHNGFLFLIYSYGLPSALIFVKRFLLTIKDKLIYSLPLFVIFVTVFVNTGFQDYRFITLMTLISTLTVAKYNAIERAEPVD